MSDPFRTPEDYELFLYSLVEQFPSISRSTLVFCPCRRYHGADSGGIVPEKWNQADDSRARGLRPSAAGN